jgi:ubiquinone/menaquinone biosynthesis C-methylase UbiE
LPIDFHDPKNRLSYASREADRGWHEAMTNLLDWEGKRVADIGCGGGIYVRALLELGAGHVTGVDISNEMLAAARSCFSGDNVTFRLGDASQTGLPDTSLDIVFNRALIHHLPELDPFFREAFRILKPGGWLVTQNRTPEDCSVPGSFTHIRGYFFEKFPGLATLEQKRRRTAGEVAEALRKAGFEAVSVHPLWEVNRTYQDMGELRETVLGRTGRSILHELSDRELTELVAFLENQLADAPFPLTEKDRWTVWLARKPIHQRNS